MRTVVLDSQPLLAYFERDEGWENVTELLKEAADGACQLFLTYVNWGEIYYITLREYNEGYAERVLDGLKNMPIELVEVDRELTMHAARIKAAGGLSYADCFAAGLAKMKRTAELVTGDEGFRRIEGQIKICWIKSAGRRSVR